MPFQKGHKPLEGAGRKKGSTTMKNRILQECLFMAGEALGELRPVAVTVTDEDGDRHARMTHEATGIDGLVGYLKWVGINHPTAFCAMLAKIIPMQVRVDTQHVIRGTFGDDITALREEIKRRGLNLERFLAPPKQIEMTATEPCFESVPQTKSESFNEPDRSGKGHDVES
jgi:hypothetical protein